MDIKKAWLLADFWPHGEVAQLFGVFRAKEGVSERANIVIDENQKIIFAKIYPDEELPDIEEVLGLLEKTQAK